MFQFKDFREVVEIVVVSFSKPGDFVFTRQKPHSGFTLAELLIALAILGVIATFTIPKIITSQQNAKYQAVAKETVSTIAAAYQQYKIQNGVSSSMSSYALTPYFNYVKTDSGRTIDSYYGSGTKDCTSETCYVLHNGGVLRPYNTTFGGTSSTNSVWYLFDPDGAVSDGTTNGPGKSIYFILYYDGRVTSWNTMAAGTYDSAEGASPACATCDPPWFSW